MTPRYDINKQKSDLLINCNMGLARASAMTLEYDQCPNENDLKWRVRRHNL